MSSDTTLVRFACVVAFHDWYPFFRVYPCRKLEVANFYESFSAFFQPFLLKMAENAKMLKKKQK